MAKNVKQFRFYENNTNSVHNQPTGIEQSAYVSGSVFSECQNIIQLGIQALPGTKFRINEGIEPVIIGRTGIYELELDNEVVISTLQFDNDSLTNISNNPNAYLIVDVIYDNGKENG